MFLILAGLPLGGKPSFAAQTPSFASQNPIPGQPPSLPAADQNIDLPGSLYPALQVIHEQAHKLSLQKGFIDSLGRPEGCPLVKGQYAPTPCQAGSPVPSRAAQTASPGNPASTLSPLETPAFSEGLPSPDQILVFVSFSMPEASLKALAQEAFKHNAMLVMRGLYQGSFAKTARKVQGLGIGVDIHPELFYAHTIRAVPTFILLKAGQAVCRLSGNVPLGFVADKFKEAP